MKADKIIVEIREKHNHSGYGNVPKEWVMDYVAEKERIQRERETRYKADISTSETTAVLKEQIKTLKQLSQASSEDAAKARRMACISNVIASCSLLIALLTFLFH